MTALQVVDYAKSLDCVHCGLCLRTCPTYMSSGLESRSPRGRIHIMRALAEGQLEVDAHLMDELDSCLLCRHCESVCPSGVEYTPLLEQAREALAEHPGRPLVARRALRFGLRRVLPSRAWIGLLAMLLELGQRSGLLRMLGAISGPLGRAARALPPMPARRDRRPLEEHYPARGERRARVAVLEGCVMGAFFGRVNRATVSVLQSCQRDVHVPRASTCCGALQAHNGDLEMARTLAKQTIMAFETPQAKDGSAAPVIVNSAGCAAQMKAYGSLLEGDREFAQRAQSFADRVRDLSEYLAEEALPELQRALGQADTSVAGPITFDDPCHLCHAQGIRSQPRQLLDLLSVERVELRESESCCGSAGLYAALRPHDSRAILQPKLDALCASRARTLVTANPGCQLQWQAGVTEAGLEVQVLHIAEVLAGSLERT